VAPWTRYNRDLKGAWHAIDDLRDEVEAMKVAASTRSSERRTFSGGWQLLIGLAVAIAVILTAVHDWIH